MKRILFSLFLLVCLCACAPQTAIPQTDVPQTDVPQTNLLPTDVPTATEPAAAPLLRIAYSKHADPWIWTEGEGPRQLADSVNVIDVRLSGDGLVVAFKRDDTGELLAVNADGSNLRTLVSAEFLAGNQLVWAFDFAPASHTVYFTLADAGNSFVPHYDLYRVDGDSNDPTPELVLPAGEGGITTFSPDGQWMTVYHPGALNLVRTDGSEVRPIFSYPEGYEPATFGPEIVWRADSSGFSFYRDSEAMFVPVSGGDPLVGPTIASLGGAVSPDGQNVAYTTPDGEVHIVTPDGTDTLYTTLVDGYFGSWLPDSVHFTVIFDVVVEGLNYQANQYSIGALGEELTRLTDTDDASDLTWLSNDRFLFVGLGELRIQTIGQPSMVLDEDVYNVVDYAWVTP